MWVLSCWPAAGYMRSYQCVQRVYIYTDLRTYIWNVHGVKVLSPIRHASRDITINQFHIPKLSGFIEGNGENGFSTIPRSILRYSIWNFNDPNSYPHIYVRSMMFSRTFWGLYWSVVNSHISVGTCRRLVPFTRRLLPVSVHVPLATTVEKIANSTRYSHIESWNSCLSCTTVTIRWTASICKYCIPVNHTTMLVWSLPVHLHQAPPQSRSPSPGLCATILHTYDISTLHTLTLLR